MAKLNTNKTLSKNLDKMLHHFETYNFIKIISNKGIQLSFISEYLKEFVRREWLFTNLVASDQPAFLINSLKTTENVNAAFENIKNFTSLVPLSLVEIDINDYEETEQLSKPWNAVQLLRNQFKIQNGTILRNYTFYPSAEEFFYKVQRSRKIWWKKFAAYPGRFTISTTNTEEDDKSFTSKIQAEFPWGLETVETIKYFPEYGTVNDKDSPEIKIGKRKKIKPQVVTCEAVLENMALTYLCDSFESPNEGSGKYFLRLDKKLAPYKVSIAGTGESSEAIKNLEDLALLLAKQIRKLGLSVLFLPDACTTSVEKQLLRNDALGVPYTILLNENTLKDGLISLRNRDTTLEVFLMSNGTSVYVLNPFQALKQCAEHSHVSLVVEYLEKLFK